MIAGIKAIVDQIRQRCLHQHRQPLSSSSPASPIHRYSRAATSPHRPRTKDSYPNPNRVLSGRVADLGSGRVADLGRVGSDPDPTTYATRVSARLLQPEGTSDPPASSTRLPRLADCLFDSSVSPLRPSAAGQLVVLSHSCIPTAHDGIPATSTGLADRRLRRPRLRRSSLRLFQQLRLPPPLFQELPRPPEAHHRRHPSSPPPLLLLGEEGDPGLRLVCSSDCITVDHLLHSFSSACCAQQSPSLAQFPHCYSSPFSHSLSQPSAAAVLYFGRPVSSSTSSLLRSSFRRAIDEHLQASRGLRLSVAPTSPFGHI